MGRSNSKELRYRVRFQHREDKQPTEVVVEDIDSSELVGMVSLTGFVFNDLKKQVILPTEDEARKRFSKVSRLHIPYHCILSVEEFFEEEPDLRNLPFMKDLSTEPDLDRSEDKDGSPESAIKNPSASLGLNLESPESFDS